MFVGSMPTLIVLVTALVLAFTTETVPLTGTAVDGSVTIGVPSELSVVSPALAGRPPRLETNSWLPTTAMACGALPTGIEVVSVPVEVLITPSLLVPFSAAYSVEPSADTASPYGNDPLGREITVGL